MINDMYGHAVGNLVALKMRDVILFRAGESDTLIRWDDDEFLLLARSANTRSVAELAGGVKSEIEEYKFYFTDDRFFHITCSIGFASFPLFRYFPAAVSWKKVIYIAERCLNASKNNREAWLGVQCTSKTLPIDLDLMNTDIPQLIDEGYLSVLLPKDDDDGTYIGGTKSLRMYGN